MRRGRLLDRFNLNLFFALDAILNAETLTEASRKMHLTQPAMSVSLKKLRSFFNDELVVYEGNETRLTALAVVLRPRVRQILQSAREVADLSPSFDPLIDEGTLIVAAPDVVEIMFIARLISGLVVEAPRVRVVLAPSDDQPVDMLFRRPLDVAIVAEPFAAPNYARAALFSEPLSCIVWKGSRFGAAICEAEFRNARHVSISQRGPDLANLVGTARNRMWAELDMVVRASSYAAMPHVLIGTDLIATTLTSYARLCATMLPVRVVPLPIDTPPISFVAQWQHYRSSEPQLQWFLGKLTQAARAITAVDDGPDHAMSTVV